MAISRKPQIPSIPLNAVNVDALIAKGGSVAQTSETPTTPSGENEKGATSGVTSFTLRVPNEILDPLDTHRKKQIYKVPRQQWILEAIMQRLEREMLPHAPKDSY